MKWDTKNSKWIYLSREEEPNLQIDVVFSEKEKKTEEKKPTIKQIIKRKLGIKE